MSLIGGGLKMQTADSCILNINGSLAAAQINPLPPHLPILREAVELESLAALLFLV